jgi:hypothetical protein
VNGRIVLKCIFKERGCEDVDWNRVVQGAQWRALMKTEMRPVIDS